MQALARQEEARGRRLAYLVQGEPDLDTPEHIKAAATEALAAGHTHYTPVEGLLELREAIAQKLETDNGVRADPKREVLVTTGGSLGLYLALGALVEPGDEVLLPDPCFASYLAMVRVHQGVPVPVPLVAQDGRFVWDLDALEARIGPRTKALLLNTPDNPTGTVLRKAELEAIAELVIRHDLVLISDEVYERFLFDGRRHVSPASLSPEIHERTVGVWSFSKTYAMTGWRLGYVSGPRDLIKPMSDLSQFSARCAAAFVQHAGLAALRGSQESVERMISEYERRCGLIVDGLARVPGLRARRPEGTFYVFPDVRALGLDSWSFARHLLAEGGVVTTPGVCYGSRGEGHVRLSFSCSTEAIRAGLEGITRAVDALGRGAPAAR
jgi:aspartate/methionine/tyrosine aminotransferase